MHNSRCRSKSSSPSTLLLSWPLLVRMEEEEDAKKNHHHHCHDDSDLDSFMMICEDDDEEDEKVVAATTPNWSLAFQLMIPPTIVIPAWKHLFLIYDNNITLDEYDVGDQIQSQQQFRTCHQWPTLLAAAVFLLYSMGYYVGYVVYQNFWANAKQQHPLVASISAAIALTIHLLVMRRQATAWLEEDAFHNHWIDWVAWAAIMMVVLVRCCSYWYCCKRFRGVSSPQRRINHSNNKDKEGEYV